MRLKVALIILSFTTLYSCKPLYNKDYTKPVFVDAKISRKTKKLHKDLYNISKQGFGIGHQDATAYGIGWNQADDPSLIKSDVNEVVNDFPAVYGFDISGIEYGNSKNIDNIPFDVMKHLIESAYKSGGVITISWHANNPVNDGDSWDTTSAVKQILNDSAINAKHELWLDNIAQFLKELKYKGKKIPIIFRPWHEMNGAWFWWGFPNCTPDEYKALWKLTVNNLKNKHKLHNLLYVYSPNTLNKGDDYLKHYPGDEYVDLLGVDIYDHNNSEKYAEQVKYNLTNLKNIATAKNKLYAFTETGAEKIPTPAWFTKTLYPSIRESGISWVLFWRNARTSHHYVPFPEHHNATDFRLFKTFPETLFLGDLKKIR